MNRDRPKILPQRAGKQRPWETLTGAALLLILHQGDLAPGEVPPEPSHLHRRLAAFLARLQGIKALPGRRPPSTGVVHGPLRAPALHGAPASPRRSRGAP